MDPLIILLKFVKSKKFRLKSDVFKEKSLSGKYEKGVCLSTAKNINRNDIAC